MDKYNRFATVYSRTICKKYANIYSQCLFYFTTYCLSWNYICEGECLYNRKTTLDFYCLRDYTHPPPKTNPYSWHPSKITIGQTGPHLIIQMYTHKVTTAEMLSHFQSNYRQQETYKTSYNLHVLWETYSAGYSMHRRKRSHLWMAR